MRSLPRPSGDGSKIRWPYGYRCDHGGTRERFPQACVCLRRARVGQDQPRSSAGGRTRLPAPEQGPDQRGSGPLCVRLFLPAGCVDWFLDHQPEIMPGHAILRFSASCSLIWPVCLSRVSSWPGSRCGSGPLLRARRWLARRVGWPSQWVHSRYERRLLDTVWGSRTRPLALTWACRRPVRIR
jgi:hypothetical protein